MLLGGTSSSENCGMSGWWKSCQNCGISGFTKIPHDSCCCGSVTKSCQTLCDLMDCSHQVSLSFTISQSLVKLHPLSQWCCLTIWSSVSPFSCLQSFPASGSFLMSQLFPSGGQTTGVSASVVPMNIEGRFPLGLTDMIFFKSKGLSRVFSNTTVQKHQFFRTQPSLWSNFQIHTWLLEKP